MDEHIWTFSNTIPIWINLKLGLKAIRLILFLFSQHNRFELAGSGLCQKCKLYLDINANIISSL